MPRDCGYPSHAELLKEIENDLDLDEGNQTFCLVCRLPIFSTPYKLYEDGHRLHKCCAERPKELIGHPLHNKPLRLHDNLDADYPYSSLCDKCSSTCDTFFYLCGTCGFTLHVSCAITVRILHRSHQHELIPFQIKDGSATCKACESKDEGEFYWCNLCEFFIHRDCALLPSTILHKKHHLEEQKHALSLTYHLSEDWLRFQKRDTCSICHEELRTTAGSYCCTRCNFITHIKCAISDPTFFESISRRDIIGGLIHLPKAAVQFTSFMEYLREKNNSDNIDTEEEKEAILRQMHSHSLTYHYNFGEGFSTSPTLICDACVQPISPPFYSCPQPQCHDFHLHDYCANLPLKYHHPAHQVHARTKDCQDLPLSLSTFPSASFRAEFGCDGCSALGNGFKYSCEKCEFTLDVRCALLPKSITHEVHGKSHILFLLYNPQYKGRCSMCRGLDSPMYYECSSCPDFTIDVDCALFQSNIKCKLDRHPLNLKSVEEYTSGSFCEICEEKFFPFHWIYQCEECITSYHLPCLSDVGDDEKIKYGGTVRVGGHKCPLTYIKLLRSYSYLCGACGLAITGNLEGVAFECIECRFWLHYECAKQAGLEACPI